LRKAPGSALGGGPPGARRAAAAGHTDQKGSQTEQPGDTSSRVPVLPIV
jgi:hypothetical protein